MSQNTDTDDNVEIGYGDEFKHVITGEVKTVHDAREGEEKVVWCGGGWDYREDLVAAINDEGSLYEVEALGEDTYVPDQY